MSAVEPTAFGPADPAIAELRECLGNRLSTAAAVREQHGHDESGWPSRPPDAVAFAQSTDEVAAIAAICSRHRVPMIPFGTGTAVEGHVQAVHGGIAVDLTDMNDVLRVATDDMDCTVQAGVTRKQLNAELRDTGLFFPVDPGADASIGGMIATRASGTNAVRYGTMAENVLSLTVVLADGRVIRTGGRARKSSAGYDLTHLFTGAEGTLGFVTEITLRLHGLPEATSAAVCAFPDEDSAVRTVIETIQCGAPVARMELVDALQMRATNAYARLDYPERPHLFLEFHGSESGVREQAELVQQLAADNGGGDFAWAVHEEDRSRLWQARHDAYPAALQLRPGCRPLTTDVCVPISRLAECIQATRADLDALSMPSTILGHVGDGNFHALILCDPDDADELAAAQAANARIVERALAMEGTSTGEHGIGQGKIDYLEREHGEAVAVMRALKTALDPLELMNPGKVLPAAAV